MKTSVFVATSIDGFIARENGGIDWLSGGEGGAEGEDYGYRKFIKSVDAIVMGRNTYRQALSFGPWPYGDKPVFVLSSQGVDIPERIAKTLPAMSANPNPLSRQCLINSGKTSNTISPAFSES